MQLFRVMDIREVALKDDAICGLEMTPQNSIYAQPDFNSAYHGLEIPTKQPDSKSSIYAEPSCDTTYCDINLATREPQNKYAEPSGDTTYCSLNIASRDPHNIYARPGYNTKKL